MVWISALRIVVLHSRAIQYTVSAYTTFISVWVLFHPTNKAVLASIVIVLLPLAIVQGLGVMLLLGRALNIKDLKDVGSPDELAKEVHTLRLEKKDLDRSHAKKEIKRELLEKLSRIRESRLPPLPPDLQEDKEEGKVLSRATTVEMARIDKKIHCPDEAELDDIYVNSFKPRPSNDYLRDSGSDRGSNGGAPKSRGNMSVTEVVWRDTIGPELEPSSSLQHAGGFGGAALAKVLHSGANRSLTGPPYPRRLGPSNSLPPSPN